MNCSVLDFIGIRTYVNIPRLASSTNVRKTVFYWNLSVYPILAVTHVAAGGLSTPIKGWKTRRMRVFHPLIEVESPPAATWVSAKTPLTKKYTQIPIKNCREVNAMGIRLKNGEISSANYTPASGKNSTGKVPFSFKETCFLHVLLSGAHISE